MCLSHLQTIPTTPMKKLSSMKLVPDAEKGGEWLFKVEK